MGLYPLLGWWGMSLLSGALALVALVGTLLLPNRRQHGAQRPQGVRAALRSGTFVTQAACAFSCAPPAPAARTAP